MSTISKPTPALENSISYGTALITITIIFVLGFLGPNATSQTEPKSAHDYYKELYRAGDLQVYSQYACFYDDATFPFRDYFFTVVFFEELLDSLKIPPETLKLLPKQDQEFFRKKSAAIYRYNKGVYMNGTMMDKDDLSSWVEISSDGKKAERFRLQRQTLRFAWTYLKSAREDSEPNAAPIFGHCEKIPTDVRQKGENQ